MSAKPTACVCGRPGVHRLNGQEYACDRCNDIDKRRIEHERAEKYQSLAKPHSRKNRFFVIEEHPMPPKFTSANY